MSTSCCTDSECQAGRFTGLSLLLLPFSARSRQQRARRQKPQPEPEGLSCTAGSWSAWNLQLAETPRFLWPTKMQCKQQRLFVLAPYGSKVYLRSTTGVEASQVRRLPGNWDYHWPSTASGRTAKLWVRKSNNGCETSFILKPVTKRAMKAYWDSRPPKTGGPPCWRTSICGSIGGTSWQCSGFKMTRTGSAHGSMPWDCFSIHPCGSCAYGQNEMVSSEYIATGP